MSDSDNKSPDELMNFLDESITDTAQTSAPGNETNKTDATVDKTTNEEQKESEDDRSAIQEEEQGSTQEKEEKNKEEEQQKQEVVSEPQPQLEQPKAEPKTVQEQEQPAEQERQSKPAASTAAAAAKPKTGSKEQKHEEQEEQDGKPMGLPAFAWNQQKPLGSLKAKDILLWRNVYASGAVFTALQALYVMLVVYEMTVLSLVSRMMLFNIVIALAYYVLRRIFTNAPVSASSSSKDGSSMVDQYMIDADAVEPYVQQILSGVNQGLRGYLSILRCDNLTKTLEFGAAVWVVSILSQLMSGLTLFFLGVWVAFTAPRVYEWQKKPIDDALDMVYREVVKYAKLAYSKIPKASAANKQTKTE